MKTNTRERIIDFVSEQTIATPKAIIEHIGFSSPAVFRHLSKLISDGVLTKHGTPPKVFYRLALSSATHQPYMLDAQVERTLQERFLKITPDGILQTGTHAFIEWCLTRKLDPVKTSLEYAVSIEKFDAYKNDGLIDGMYKIKHALPSVYLDRLYYFDFYSIERFGKTKLGELILYAKQSQNSILTKRVAEDVRDRVLAMVECFKIDAVGFISPTVKRNIQFMKELERFLRLSLPTIKITKIRTPIIIPQKSLSRLEERIQNAQQSLVVEEEKMHHNVLLIDDAVGSGATINEIARQIRAKKICTGEIVGLALTGSFSGFEVIQEV